MADGFGGCNEGFLLGWFLRAAFGMTLTLVWIGTRS